MNTELIKNTGDDIPELHWEVTLDNGQTACEYETVGQNSWHNLRDFCVQNNLAIVEMRLVFRSNVVQHSIASDLPISGWFLSKKAEVYQIGGETQYAYVIGTLHGDKVHTKTYKVPELLLVDQDVREKDPCRYNLIESPVRAKLKMNLKNITF